LALFKEKKTRSRIKKPVQKRSIETRKRIINAAKDLFAEKGFEDTNTNLIASYAGLSIGGLYAHFANKWEIFYAILEDFSLQTFEYLKKNITDITEDRKDLNETVDSLIHGLYRATMLNGQLNAEIAKFALQDKTAGEIRSAWEEKINQEIIKLIDHFGNQLRIKNIEIVVSIVHRSAHEIFQYLYKNRGQVDEEKYLREFITMLQRYLKG
jgi:AcrR family transcriptional regulator